jgi:hypothetical protein
MGGLSRIMVEHGYGAVKPRPAVSDAVFILITVSELEGKE